MDKVSAASRTGVAERSKSRKALGVGFFVLALVLAGCGSNGDETGSAASPTSEPEQGGGTEDQTGTETTEQDALAELVTAAEEEGSLTFYTAMNTEQAEAAVEAFGDEYAVDVEILRLVTAKLVQRYAAEADIGTSEADLISQTDQTFLDTVDQEHPDWLVPTSEWGIPAFEEDWKGTPFIGPRGVTFTIGPLAILYEEGGIDESELPDNWCGVANDAWDGQMAVAAVPSGLIQSALMVHLIDNCDGDVIGDLVELGVRHEDSAQPAAQKIVAGEYKVVFPGTFGNAQSGGETMTVHIPTPIFSFDQKLSIPADAQNPNAARLFANWLLSEEGQTVVNAGPAKAISPVYDDIEGALEPPSRDFAEPDLAEVRSRQDEIAQKFGL